MHKVIVCLIMALTLTSCSLFQVHKLDIEQGNVITTEQLSQLHPGMSEATVRQIMGDPVLVDIFSQHRLDYVYTLKKGHGSQVETRIVCLFQNGILQAIQRR